MLPTNTFIEANSSQKSITIRGSSSLFFYQHSKLQIFFPSTDKLEAFLMPDLNLRCSFENYLTTILKDLNLYKFNNLLKMYAVFLLTSAAATQTKESLNYNILKNAART